MLASSFEPRGAFLHRGDCALWALWRATTEAPSCYARLAKMPRRPSASAKNRRPLSKERILRAAIHLVDEGGLESLSMRNLSELLGVGTMSLYNHVANKEEVLDGIIELVALEIHVPTAGVDWRASMRQRAVSMREVILRHPWAARLIESQTNLGPTRLRSLDATLGSLRRAGFSVEGAARALLLMDSYIYGFTLQETSWNFDASSADAGEHPVRVPQEYPYLSEVQEHFTRDNKWRGREMLSFEFESGFERILDVMANLLGENGGAVAQ